METIYHYILYGHQPKFQYRLKPRNIGYNVIKIPNLNPQHKEYLATGRWATIYLSKRPIRQHLYKDRLESTFGTACVKKIRNLTRTKTKKASQVNVKRRADIRGMLISS
jgi:hypothetical protein